MSLQAEKLRRRHLVARRAMQGYDDLPTAEKIELLNALAEILPTGEAEAARHAAFLLQEAQRKQLEFSKLLVPEIKSSSNGRDGDGRE